jgi:hypothetical protein
VWSTQRVYLRPLGTQNWGANAGSGGWTPTALSRGGLAVLADSSAPVVDSRRRTDQVFLMMEVDWTRFFREYATASQAHDVASVAAFYADGFLVAGPTGAQAFKNDDTFREWLGQVFHFNEQMGLESLDVAGVRPTPIDERHVLVAVDWVTRFTKTEVGSVAFRISYIVSLVDSERPKLIGYISQEDQQDLMKRRGLI